MAQGGKKAAKTQYVCSACGASFAKWSCQCSECHSWNVLEESLAPTTSPKGRFAGYAGTGGQQVMPLTEVEIEHEARTTTDSAELDRVLGGGL
ncbi:MAG: DNA repair protein RadA, partial [Candidatus Thiodiazotropha endolucinida]|nr:DNA repair protein RadA [Candidatus Thiodiazotropha taylori]MCW4241060.1 DNA repair protein RadA [Candidatus Thiodiazotropha taylori]